MTQGVGATAEIIYDDQPVVKIDLPEKNLQKEVQPKGVQYIDKVTGYSEKALTAGSAASLAQIPGGISLQPYADKSIEYSVQTTNSIARKSLKYSEDKCIIS